MDLDATQVIPLDFDDEDDTGDDQDKITTGTPAAFLKVLGKKGFPESSFPLFEGDNYIGRGVSCKIHLPLKSLSKQHACIEIKGTNHFVYDNHSQNKSKRNGMLMRPGVRYELTEKHQLIFADVQCLYMRHPEPADAVTKPDEQEAANAEEDSGSETGSESMIPLHHAAHSEKGAGDIVETQEYQSDDDTHSEDIFQPTQAYEPNKSPVYQATQAYAPDGSGPLLGKNSSSPFKVPGQPNKLIYVSESDVEEENDEDDATKSYRVSGVGAATQCYDVLEETLNCEEPQVVQETPSKDMAATQAYDEVEELDETGQPDSPKKIEHEDGQTLAVHSPVKVPLSEPRRKSCMLKRVADLSRENDDTNYGEETQAYEDPLTSTQNSEEGHTSLPVQISPLKAATARRVLVDTDESLDATRSEDEINMTLPVSPSKSTPVPASEPRRKSRMLKRVGDSMKEKQVATQPYDDGIKERPVDTDATQSYVDEADQTSVDGVSAVEGDTADGDTAGEPSGQGIDEKPSSEVDVKASTTEDKDMAETQSYSESTPGVGIQETQTYGDQKPDQIEATQAYGDNKSKINEETQAYGDVDFTSPVFNVKTNKKVAESVKDQTAAIEQMEVVEDSEKSDDEPSLIKVPVHVIPDEPTTSKDLESNSTTEEKSVGRGRRKKKEVKISDKENVMDKTKAKSTRQKTPKKAVIIDDSDTDDDTDNTKKDIMDKTKDDSADKTTVTKRNTRGAYITTKNTTTSSKNKSQDKLENNEAAKIEDVPDSSGDTKVEEPTVPRTNKRIVKTTVISDSMSDNSGDAEKSTSNSRASKRKAKAIVVSDSMSEKEKVAPTKVSRKSKKDSKSTVVSDSMSEKEDIVHTKATVVCDPKSEKKEAHTKVSRKTKKNVKATVVSDSMSEKEDIAPNKATVVSDSKSEKEEAPTKLSRGSKRNVKCTVISDSPSENEEVAHNKTSIISDSISEKEKAPTKVSRASKRNVNSTVVSDSTSEKEDVAPKKASRTSKKNVKFSSDSMSDSNEKSAEVSLTSKRSKKLNEDNIVEPLASKRNVRSKTDVTSKADDVTMSSKSDDVTITPKADDVTMTSKADDVTMTSNSDDVTIKSKAKPPKAKSTKKTKVEEATNKKQSIEQKQETAQNTPVKRSSRKRLSVANTLSQNVANILNDSGLSHNDPETENVPVKRSSRKRASVEGHVEAPIQDLSADGEVLEQVPAKRGRTKGNTAQARDTPSNSSSDITPAASKAKQQKSKKITAEPAVSSTPASKKSRGKMVAPESGTKRGRGRQASQQDSQTPSHLSQGSIVSPVGTPVNTPRGSRRSLIAQDSPTLRNRPDQNLKIMFTGISDENFLKVIKELGGQEAKTLQECTHLVTDKVRRTVKFLSALAKGIPIVATNWLENCKEAHMFLDSSKYIVRDLDSEKKYKFKLATSLEKASRSHLLDGYKIHVTKSVGPPPNDMKVIIQCAGGQYLTNMPKEYSEDLLVVSNDKDRKLFTAAENSGIPIVTNEFILTGILRQEFSTEIYQLKSEAATPSKKGRKK